MSGSHRRSAPGGARARAAPMRRWQRARSVSRCASVSWGQDLTLRGGAMRKGQTSGDSDDEVPRVEVQPFVGRREVGDGRLIGVLLEPIDGVTEPLTDEAFMGGR